MLLCGKELPVIPTVTVGKGPEKPLIVTASDAIATGVAVAGVAYTGILLASMPYIDPEGD